MWRFRRKGPSGFSWYSTAVEVTNGLDGTGLTAIVTGSSSGIGAETARVLALRGVHVILAVRNLSAGNNLTEAICKENPAAKVDVMELNLASLESVRKFASEYNSRKLPLNLLINNAGITGIPFELSEDGIELQFATNYLGLFLLTNLLVENMKKTARDSKIEGRIVNVSSIVHRLTYRGGVRFDKINDQIGYNTFAAYGQSKLANILHANELARRFKEEGVDITANSLHPGAIVTNILRNMWFIKILLRTLGRLSLKNTQQGAATTCYLAMHPEIKGVSGKYFSDSNVGEASSNGRDTELAKKLWDFSMGLIN